MSNTLVDNLINETKVPETPASQSTSMRLPKQTCSVKTDRLGIQESFVSMLYAKIICIQDRHQSNSRVMLLTKI